MRFRRIVTLSVALSIPFSIARSVLRSVLLSGGIVALGIVGAVESRADGPADNAPDNVRRVPPPGIAVPAADRARLEESVVQLGKDMDDLRNRLKSKPALFELLPDVQIYYNAVHYALAYNEFYNAREIDAARALLAQGAERATQLQEGKAPWTTQTGLVVRGYVSKIDGSVQPYGLVVPTSYRTDDATKHRLDIWFHGRGENLSELSFIDGRQKSVGEFAPPDAFVLHPYGRYCNANRFAGEVDTQEALEHVRKHYPIDPNRIAVRGFSMGGAACWDFAVHYAGDWAAANPGAGFSETADFLKVFQNEAIKPTWYAQKLWHLYDAVDYAENLFNCPTVAYSGEVDGQRQAAEKMTSALAAEGMSLTHILGPKAGHFYEKSAKEEVARRVDSIVAVGRNPAPRKIRFTTWTLRYNRMLWVTVDALDRHWERARVDAEVTDANTVTVKTENVAALSLDFAPGLCPLEITHKPKVMLNGQTLEAPSPQTDRSWTVHIRKSDNRWAVVPAAAENGGLVKQHGLQGPIDDAFMDSFLFVKPSGQAMNPKVGAWTDAELAHAVDHWRRQFRGEARVKTDSEITDADIATNNLVLFGDPSSNKILAKIAADLPIRWDAQGIHVGGQTYAADHHVPILIYPNPLHPQRYVVLNSGFTFREVDYLNNARQTPKLPDWAIVDLSVPVSSQAPGGIVDANFFGEKWEWLPAPKRP